MLEFLAGFITAFLIVGIFCLKYRKAKRNSQKINNEVDLLKIVKKTTYSIQEATKNAPRQRVKVFFGMVLSAQQNQEEKDNHSIQVSKIIHAGVSSEINTEIINKTENYIQFSVEIAVGKDSYTDNIEKVNFGLEEWY